LLCWRSGGVEHLHDTPPYPSRRHQLSPIAPAGERHMQGLHLGDLAEKIFRADMRTRADAGAAEGEASTLPVHDELFQVFRRIARMHGENVGTKGHDGDGAQIVDREALVFGRCLIDRKETSLFLGNRGFFGRFATRLPPEILLGSMFSLSSAAHSPITL